MERERERGRKRAVARASPTSHSNCIIVFPTLLEFLSLVAAESEKVPHDNDAFDNATTTIDSTHPLLQAPHNTTLPFVPL